MDAQDLIVLQLGRGYLVLHFYLQEEHCSTVTSSACRHDKPAGETPSARQLLPPPPMLVSCVTCDLNSSVLSLSPAARWWMSVTCFMLIPSRVLQHSHLDTCPQGQQGGRPAAMHHVRGVQTEAATERQERSSPLLHSEHEHLQAAAKQAGDLKLLRPAWFFWKSFTMRDL